jgi:hypothetical protein
MPKILMSKSADGCDDGIHAKTYNEGETYDVSESLAKDFMSVNACKLVSEKSDEPEKKSIGDAPKNKAKQAPLNKSDSGEK